MHEYACAAKGCNQKTYARRAPGGPPLCRRCYDRERTGRSGVRLPRPASRNRVERRASDAPWVDLLRQSAPLGEGACTNLRPQIFDGDTPDDVRRALAACNRCPVLGDCRNWVESLPEGAVSGVVGGELHSVHNAKRTGS